MKNNNMTRILCLLIAFFVMKQTIIAQDSDGDGIVDLQDLDDDNDGILDSQECGLTIQDLSTKLTGGMSNYEDGGNPDYFLRIRPSDFGYNFNGTGITGINTSHDYSAFYGLPAGSIIVTLINAHVHPTADVFFTRKSLGSSTIEVSGTVGTYVQFEHDAQYFDNQYQTLTINDGASLANNDLFELSHTSSDGTTWEKTQVHPNYTLTRLTGGGGIAIGTLNYAEINPQRPHSISFSTNEDHPNSYSVHFLRLYPECDADKDGIPNRLDTDSDNDGCTDTLEGANTAITEDNLVAASGTVSVGTGSNAENKNLGTVVDSNGVPTILSSGQGIGSSQATVTLAVTVNPKDVTTCVAAAEAFTFMATAIGGSTSITYQWQLSTNNGTTWTNVSTITGATISGTDAGTVTSGRMISLVLTNIEEILNGTQFRVRYSHIYNACEKYTTESAKITVNALPVIPTVNTTITEVCVGEDYSFTINGTASDVVTYSLAGETASITLIGGQATVSDTAQSGMTSVTLTLIEVTNDKGCSISATASTTLIINELPEVTSIISDNTNYCTKDEVSFYIKGTGSSVVTYRLDGGAPLDITLPSSGQFTLTVSGLSGEEAVLEIINIVSSSGCSSSSTDSSTISLSGKLELEGPSDLCLGNSVVLSGVPLSGVFLVSDRSIASINSNGLLTGLSIGDVVVTYMNGGCTATKTIRIYEGVSTVNLAIEQPICKDGVKISGSVQITNYSSTMSYEIMKSGALAPEVTIDSEGYLSPILEGVNYAVARLEGSCRSQNFPFILVYNGEDCGNTVTPVCSLSRAEVSVTSPECKDGVKIPGSVQITNYSSTLSYTITNTEGVATDVMVGVEGILTGVVSNVIYTLVVSNSVCSSSPTTFELVDNGEDCGSTVTPVCSLPKAEVSVTSPECKDGVKVSGSVQITNYSSTLSYTITNTEGVATDVMVGVEGMLTGVVSNVIYTLVVSNGVCSSSPTTFELVDNGESCGDTQIPCTIVAPIVKLTIDCDTNHISGQILNYNSDLTYSITPSTDIDGEGKLNSLIIDGVYVLTSSGVSGCISSVTFVAKDDQSNCTVICEGVEVPTGFSPNSDKYNDVFEIPCLPEKYPNFRMRIYNRWGNIVYDYTHDGSSTVRWWNGYSTGHMTINKDRKVPVGTYFYIIDSNKGEGNVHKGWVYLNY